MRTIQEPHLVSAAEAASRLGFSTRTVIRWCVARKIKGATLTPDGWFLPEKSISQLALLLDSSYTVSQVASLWSCSPKSVRRLIKAQRLKSWPLSGNRVRIHDSAIAEYEAGGAA